MNGDGVCQRGEEWQARVLGSQKSWVFVFPVFLGGWGKDFYRRFDRLKGAGQRLC
jgi:hypothetical protein